MYPRKYFGEHHSKHPPTPMTELLGEQHNHQPHVIAVASLKAWAMRRLDEVGYSVPLHRLRAAQGEHVEALHRAGLTRDGMVLAVSNTCAPGTPVVRALSNDTALLLGWFDRESGGEQRCYVQPAYQHDWVDTAAREGFQIRLCQECGVVAMRAIESASWTYYTEQTSWTLDQDPICVRPRPSSPSIPQERTGS